ncbi:MAG: DNA replication/repair protein RecF [Rickettsiales bacterium]|nr:DNA replication/repair protein RecF [Rickettsiales bacterium]
MLISSIQNFSCSFFRNYEHVSFKPESKFIIITGNNGIGKTNILEALSLFSPGRGLRNTKLEEMLNLNFSPLHPWKISGTIHGIDGESIMTTQFLPEIQEKKRHISINEIEIKKQQDLYNICSISWVIPQMDGVFIQGSSSRRKFLDKLCSNFNNTYADTLNKYEYFIKERLALLKQDKPDQDWLTVVERKASELAVIIAAIRVETCSIIQNILEKLDYNLPKIRISVEGNLEKQIFSTPSLQLEQDFCNILKKNRDFDALSKRTNVGIHRSDLLVFNISKNINADMCSTGEQKLLLLAIFLAEVLAFIEVKGIIPILLLDDIMSYLDRERRYMLYEIIRDIGAQVWMTGTDEEHFDLITSGQIVKIQNNKIVI